MVREPIDIEGFRPEDLPGALGEALEREILSGRPLVVRSGTAEVLLSLGVEGTGLRAELAHVDGGGEGVLPALFAVVVRLAVKHELRHVEWIVFAASCAKPNPRLRPILERRGFQLREIVGRGLVYHRRDEIGGER